MIGQVAAVYFQSYQLAYDLAKKAQKCFEIELYPGDVNAPQYVRFGYWDSLRKGLLAGEKLQLDLRKLEAAYMEGNKRELELTKHVSLAMIAPEKLLELRESGTTTFTVSKHWFNLDYPGHYRRRIKSVSMSIPCVAGPYTTIAATLRHGSGKMSDSGGNLVALAPHFATIATSSAQNDSGVFELSFRDERYLPFEGAGAEDSQWTLDMMTDPKLRQFDYSAISDVILHIRYTALEDGAMTTLKGSRITDLNAFMEGTLQNVPKLDRYFSLRHEFSNEWHAYASAFAGTYGTRLNIPLQQDQYPFFCQAKKVNIRSLHFYLRPDMMPGSGYELELLDSQGNRLGTRVTLSLTGGYWQGTFNLAFPLNGSAVSIRLIRNNDYLNIAGVADQVFLVTGYTCDADYVQVPLGTPLPPVPVPEVVAWWKADSAQNVLQSGAVQTLHDHSGKGNHISAVSASTRPALIADWKNGKPALAFAGSQGMRLPMLNLASEAPSFTVFMVGEKKSADVSIMLELSDNFNVYRGFSYILNETGLDSAGIRDAGYNIYGVPYNTTLNNPGVYVLSFNIGDSDPETAVEFNDLVYQNPFNGGGYGADNPNGFSSQPFTIGARTGGLGPAHFNLAELILLPYKASTVQRKAVKDYFKTKYGF
jgi:hypothetical protein